MLIYLTLFSTLLTIVVLVFVYLSDRWEHEPIELIQSLFCVGLLGQLALVLAVQGVVGARDWKGILPVVTAAAVALAVPVFAFREREFDEDYDGVVYSVVLMSGAAAVVHFWNLPAAAAESSFRGVVGGGALPGARDVAIFVASPGPLRNLMDYAALLTAALASGTALGIQRGRGASRAAMLAASAATGAAVAALDLATGGRSAVRVALLVLALVAAAWLKRRSPFRERPEALEADVVLKAVKTGFLVLGATVFAFAVILSLDGANRFRFLESGEAVRPAPRTEALR